ncbi:MAG: HepT-like ribonuclease domain-containing protein [Deinococcota bacterium]
MSNMVGFRNVLVHDYQSIDLAIVKGIVEHRLDDLIKFADEFVQNDAKR